VVRAGTRAQVRRAGGGAWTAATERRFLGALAATKDLVIAVTSAGTSSTAAYRRRAACPGFAESWREALACAEPEVLAWWVESMAAMMEGCEQSTENPVRITSCSDVIRLYERSLRPGWRHGRPPRAGG